MPQMDISSWIQTNSTYQFCRTIATPTSSQATPLSYRHNSRKGSADLRSPQSVQTFPRSLEPRERSSEKFDVWWNMLNMKATNAMRIPCLPTVTDPKFINSKQVSAEKPKKQQFVRSPVMIHNYIMMAYSCIFPFLLVVNVITPWAFSKTQILVQPLAVGSSRSVACDFAAVGSFMAFHGFVIPIQAGIPHCLIPPADRKETAVQQLLLHYGPGQLAIFQCMALLLLLCSAKNANLR